MTRLSISRTHSIPQSNANWRCASRVFTDPQSQRRCHPVGMSFHSSANFSRLLQQRLLPATNLFKLSNYDFSSTAQLPAAQAQRTSALPLRNLPYFVRRTPSNQLPVYTATQTGGTRQQTKVQKTEGDLNVMREHMAKALGIDGLNDVSISRGVDGQIYIVVEGWRKAAIQHFLTERGF